MVIRSLATVLIIAASAAAPAYADDAPLPRGVIEMFTSQGCSSCPPADKAMEALARRQDVIALSYHVDYWNYLGWADTLATPENTARQYGYARTLGRSGVYTPQAVLNGRDHVSGANGAVILDKLEGMNGAGTGLKIRVEANKRGDEIDIDIGPGKGRAEVVMVYFKREQTVDVLKGENKGSRITYWNSVTDVQTVGMWDGKQLKLVLPAKVMESGDNGGCAVLLQKSGPKGEPGTILGATMIVAAKGS